MKPRNFVIGIILATLLFVSFVEYNHFSWNDVFTISFFQNLANPSVRIVRIEQGFRKEQIASRLATTLGWSKKSENEFLKHTNNDIISDSDNGGNLEGYYFPKTYMISEYSNPSDVSDLMLSEFQNQTKDIYKIKKTKIINQDTAVTVASIIQREAAGKQDMRLISGIIYNRIFKGMKLQMDATLQYAKGTEADWWPQVIPADKNIESPYNTYKYPIPPNPIASPGLEAIKAAYNPETTSCLFYIHDSHRKIHCAQTYEQHKRNIALYY